MSCWYDNKTHAESLKNDVFKLLLVSFYSKSFCQKALTGISGETLLVAYHLLNLNKLTFFLNRRPSVQPD